MDSLFNKQMMSNVALVLLVAYSSMFAPEVPSKFAKILDYSIVRVILLAALTYMLSNGAVLPSVVFAIAFVYGMMLLVQSKLFEGFEVEDAENTNIPPGCVDVTYTDILNSFKGDKAQMALAMQNYVNTSYTSAPQVAAQLINHGHYINDKCKLF